MANYGRISATLCRLERKNTYGVNAETGEYAAYSRPGNEYTSNRSISGILIICRECLWNSGVIIRPIGKENLILVYGQGVWDLDMIRLHLTIFVGKDRRLAR